MSERNAILVTGATGKIGRHLVSRLHESGARVRALTRNPAAASLPGGVEVVRGDLSEAATFEPLLEGVDVVFLLWPWLSSEGAPEIVDAIARHARRIVFLSSMSVPDADDQETEPLSHAEMERMIEKSGLRWTFLRPGGFATNTLGWAQQVRADGVVRWPSGAGGGR